MSALIDTGAPITFFDRGAADAVGLKLDFARRDPNPIRILGGSWFVQFEYVELTVPVEQHPLTWTARVAFAYDPNLQMPFQGVLGTDGFLDKFAVTFNKYYDYFVVERPDDFHDRVGGPLIEDDPVRASEESWKRGGRHFTLGR